MKTITAILAASAVLSGGAATLTWDDPNPVGLVASFRVYREVGGGAFSMIAEVTTNRWTISLPNGRNTVYVTAVGTEGLESVPSTNAFITIVVSPNNIQVKP